jgi:hypothetical protein
VHKGREVELVVCLKGTESLQRMTGTEVHQGYRARVSNLGCGVERGRREIPVSL